MQCKLAFRIVMVLMFGLPGRTSARSIRRSNGLSDLALEYFRLGGGGGDLRHSSHG